MRKVMPCKTYKIGVFFDGTRNTKKPDSSKGKMKLLWIMLCSCFVLQANNFKVIELGEKEFIFHFLCTYI